MNLIPTQAGKLCPCPNARMPAAARQLSPYSEPYQPPPAPFPEVRTTKCHFVRGVHTTDAKASRERHMQHTPTDEVEQAHATHAIKPKGMLANTAKRGYMLRSDMFHLQKAVRTQNVSQ